jgi:RND family efflux transporter MFP subunit
MKQIRYAALMLLMVIAYACGTKESKTAAPNDAVVVKTAAVETISYAPTLQYSGMMAAKAEAKLSFKIGGVVAKVLVKEGDRVSKGQLLATLDLTEINAQVQQATKAVEKAKRDVARVKNLYEDTAATLELYQNVQTQLDVANENLRIAQFNQQYAQIKATDNGTVIKKIMNEGEVVGPGIPVLLIYGNNNNDWVVKFGVSDKDWAILKLGQQAAVAIDAYPDKNFQGIINRKADVADPYNNTYEIEVKVIPNGQKFASGLFSTVQLKAALPKQTTMIPIEAITEGDGKTGFVFTLNKDKTTVTKHKVMIAFLTNDKVAISQGLDGITSVVTDGVSYLTETSKVIVANQ